MRDIEDRSKAYSGVVLEDEARRVLVSVKAATNVWQRTRWGILGGRARTPCSVMATSSVDFPALSRPRKRIAEVVMVIDISIRVGWEVGMFLSEVYTLPFLLTSPTRAPKFQMESVSLE